MFDPAAYLARIGLTTAPSIDADGLRALHRAHLATVPFENLDIARKREIVLDLERLYDKIVVRRRGGFCYELNGLFATLLEDLGFRVTMLSARVKTSGDGFGPEFDHMALQVDLDEPWLADVGFGDCFLEPLPLREGEHADPAGAFALRRDQTEWLLERRGESGWSPEYLFTLDRRELGDYVPMCHYQQTSQESSFTRKRVCSRATAEGRITLSNDRLIVTRNGVREERQVESPDVWDTLLREEFGIVM